ncbi:signal recognition particle-docking protein FtsY [Pseudomonas chlororaphis]|uniref:signal recognition particle-docking protein FtsY n=1 Tax=Pseudomonas chlororaphis TaxID=587753 RepID=UPI000F56FA46|nr:signal recognition particle-docking protein FtsY [Pseudomonas chlororaphis]AZC53819.1 Signal recognition particle receptor FtsY [Pseudomonas chlororaphis subsp. piscium]AZC60147.1 Signal recognition particle receptor FtsY [Pseudomonas chlororaphis subsp. piscium]AZC85100.1 Signal recognition particle receptor FtsY [Pseudomonas chlororaphis subsp. piscium]AZC92384.1 Signal recognition particle receptor FtsY [Pseudomonas chlororaphis subsp. piscium]MBP5059103.1 signal recognition particle-doc
MFGSNDDKKTPAAAGEKKGLFGWLRKKPQETVVEQPQVPVEPAPAPAPVIEQAAPVAEVAAPVVSPIAEPIPQPEQPAAAVEPAPAPELPLTPDPEHKPWLTLPVAEEPVALVEDEQAPHITPPIPAATDVQQAAELLVAELAHSSEPAEAQALIEEEDVPQPVIAAFVQPEPVRAPEPAPVVAAPVAPVAPVAAVEAPAAVEPPRAEENKVGFFARLKQGLSKTSASIGEGMASLFLGKKTIDDELLEDIETRLLTADVGVEATAVIIQNLTQKVARKQLTDVDALYKSLQAELASMLKPVEQPLRIASQTKPFVILVVGVNGAGKTTTIGKLAKKLQLEGKKVMLAAGDTFRAAAVEQLQVWGERNKIPVIAQHTGADSASVIFDAVQAAKARGIDVLIADTAGRLHTKDNLMEELKKVRRVIGKLDADAPHEVLLVLDAGTGQNAINQAKQFNQTVELTGLALTKLDGTAKGGVIFALAKQFGLPIRYIGVGEGIDDLRAFEAEPFVQALFAERERS